MLVLTGDTGRSSASESIVSNPNPVLLAVLFLTFSLAPDSLARLVTAGAELLFKLWS